MSRGGWLKRLKSGTFKYLLVLIFLAWLGQFVAHFYSRVYEIHVGADFHIHGCTRLRGQISKVIWKNVVNDVSDDDVDGQ